MLKFSSKKILLGIFVAVSALVFLKFLSLVSFSQSEIILEKGELLDMEKQETVAQKFTSNRDNLKKISFLVRSSGVKKGDKVSMRLADENCENVIREGLLLDSFVDSDNLYEFKFKPVPDSNGKTYCILATFEPKNPNAKPIRLFTTDDNHFQFPAENITTGQKMAGHLSIRPAFENDSVWQDLGELNQRISQYKPFFLKHYFLWFVVISFLLLSTGLVIVLIRM